MDDDLREMTEEVPDVYVVRFAKIAELTDEFCDAHLNAEYKDLRDPLLRANTVDQADHGKTAGR